MNEQTCHHFLDLLDMMLADKDVLLSEKSPEKRMEIVNRDVEYCRSHDEYNSKSRQLRAFSAELENFASMCEAEDKYGWNDEDVNQTSIPAPELLATISTPYLIFELERRGFDVTLNPRKDDNND